MRSQLMLAWVLVAFFICSAGKAYSQAYMFSGPVAVFTYDNAGNRVKREIKIMCVGVGCPPIASDGPVGRPANPAPYTTDGPSDHIAVDAYPNPTENELNISNNTWQENDKAVVVVYDINSKVILKKEISQAKDKISFDKAVPGTYMVQYYLNNAPVQLWKIIKP